MVAPAALAHGFVGVELDGADGAHRFHEVGVRAGAGDDLFLGAAPEAGVHDHRDDEVDEGRRHHEEGERGADQRHHDHGGDGEDRIDEDVDDALGQQLLDRPDRPDARQEVADVAALEIVDAQAQQVADYVAGELVGEGLADGENHPGAQ
jgi:hypothetical protein